MRGPSSSTSKNPRYPAAANCPMTQPSGTTPSPGTTRSGMLTLVGTASASWTRPRRGPHARSEPARSRSRHDQNMSAQIQAPDSAASRARSPSVVTKPVSWRSTFVCSTQTRTPSVSARAASGSYAAAKADSACSHVVSPPAGPVVASTASAPTSCASSRVRASMARSPGHADSSSRVKSRP